MQTPSFSAWLPWTDRAGRPSPLKLAVFVATLAPALWMAFEWHQGWFSVKPLTDTIRESGDWALRLLVASLAVTPLRLLTGWNRLIQVRRMLGLAALAYTLVHVVLYCFDLQLDVAAILSEIVLRTYLTVGTVATIGLVALGLTSNDLSIHRLGARRAGIFCTPASMRLAVLSLLHEFMEVKIDSYEVSHSDRHLRPVDGRAAPAQGRAFPGLCPSRRARRRGRARHRADRSRLLCTSRPASMRGWCWRPISIFPI